ncbi:MAG: hypothetical protein WCF85_18490 [Rhodospirillaceae bacterium]
MKKKLLHFLAILAVVVTSLPALAGDAGTAANWPAPGTSDYPGYGPDSVYGVELDIDFLDVKHAEAYAGKPLPALNSPAWRDRAPGQLYKFANAHQCHSWASRKGHACDNGQHLPTGWVVSDAKTASEPLYRYCWKRLHGPEAGKVYRSEPLPHAVVMSHVEADKRKSDSNDRIESWAEPDEIIQPTP